MRIGWAWTVAAQSANAKIADVTTICTDVGRNKCSALRRTVSNAHAKAALFIIAVSTSQIATHCGWNGAMR
jgi:hypothetical protein